MNFAEIWWRQVGRSLRLCQEVVRRAYAETSFVLYLPRRLPWEAEFYDVMKDRLSSLQADRMVRFVTCSGLQPGEQVLSELCSEDVRTGYWPGQSPAVYLAGLSDIPLNQMFVWVRQIETAGQLEQWRSFAAQYTATAVRRDPEALHAVFILESRKAASSPAGESAVQYGITDGDCQVFCLEAAALQEELPTEYLAALAQCVGAGDPELSGRLILRGKTFLQDPVNTARQVLSDESADSGEPFAGADKTVLHLRVWRAQIMTLFALVEEKRLAYIRTNEDRLRAWMPTPAENGALIRDPYELEFGNLFYMTRHAETDFTRQETEQIELCREVRNLLAHNELVPYDKVQALLQS